MIHRFVLALLLLPFAAHAGPSCAPGGLFIPGATGSPMLSGWNAGGAWRGWWCPKSRYGWEAKPYVHVVLASFQWTVNPNAQINSILSAPSPTVALIEAINRFEVIPTSDQDKAADVILRQEGLAALRAARPADPRYVVSKATRSDGTRPVYQLTEAGVPGLEVARAQAGTPCACHVAAIDSGTNAWCPPAGALPRLAVLCQPAP